MQDNLRRITYSHNSYSILQAEHAMYTDPDFHIINRCVTSFLFNGCAFLLAINFFPKTLTPNFLLGGKLFNDPTNN